MGRPFTRKEDDFLRANYLNVPAKRLSKLLGRSCNVAAQRMKILGLIVPPEITEKFRQESQFKKGATPVNKGKKWSEFMDLEAQKKSRTTCFKKGQTPHNAIGFKNGDITVRQEHPERGGRPYKYIRLDLNKWIPLHTHRWEKKHGKLPRGHCLWFKAGNSLNCRLNNLELITRVELMARNTIQRYPAEIQQSMKLLSKLNKTITYGQK